MIIGWLAPQRIIHVGPRFGLTAGVPDRGTAMARDFLTAVQLAVDRVTMNRLCGRSSIWLVVLSGCLLAGCGTPNSGSSSADPGRADTAVSSPLTTLVVYANPPSSASTSVEATAQSGVAGQSGSAVVASPAIAPSAPNQPVLVVRWQSTGGSCADQHTLVPRLVIYADGQVVRTDPDSLGQYCFPIPTFRTGQVDLAAVRARVEEYLATPSSTVVMSRAEGVADAGLTILEYTEVDGSRRLVAADAIDVGLGQLSDEQRSGRLDLAAIIAVIDELTPTTTEWTPSAINIIKPEPWVPLDSPDQVPAWPVPLVSQVQQLLGGAEGSCTTITGPDAAELLTAAHARSTAAATWAVDGQPSFLAIGVVLDGFSSCQ